MTARVLSIISALSSIAGALTNDNFYQPVDLGTEIETSFRAHPAGATLQTGEPRISSGNLWYTWQAPADGTLEISSDSRFIGIYEGAIIDSLEYKGTVGSVIEVFSGTQYRISCFGEDIIDAEVSFTPLPQPPANDSFSSPLVIAPWDTETYIYKENASLATWEEGESRIPTSINTSTLKSLWVEWTAPADGLFSIILSEPNLIAKVYSGDQLADLQTRLRLYSSFNPTTTISGPSFLRVTENETLRIALIDYDVVEREMTAEFTFTLVNSEMNVNPSSATSLGSALTQEVVSTIQGSPSLSNPDKEGWWKWTAPQNGALEVHASWQTPDLHFDGFYKLVDNIPQDWDNVQSGNSRDRKPQSYFANIHAGQEIYLKWTEDEAKSFSRFDLQFHEAVPNDDFKNALDLGSASTVNHSGSNYEHVTKEPGFPDSEFSQWWFWTAPSSGLLLIETNPTNVYRDSSFAELTLAERIAYLDRSAIQVTAGERIYFDNANSSSNFLITPRSLAFKFIPTFQENDDLADAAHLGNGTNIRAAALMTGATVETGEPDPYATGSEAASRWWKWTSATDGVAYVQAYIPTTNVSVFTQTQSGELLEVTDILSQDSQTGFTITDGDEFWIRIEKSPGFDWIEFTIDTFDLTSLPDDLVEAKDLGNAHSWAEEFPLTLATKEANEPLFLENETNHSSLWFTWTAGAKGTLELSKLTSSTSSKIAIFSASPFTAENDEWESSFTSLERPVEEGEKLWIGLLQTSDARQGKTGFSLDFRPIHPNSKFEDAIDLGNLWSASASVPWSSEWLLTLGEEGWFRWTAPSDGRVHINRDQKIFQGTSEDTLEFLGEGTHLRVDAGQTYHFLVDVRDIVNFSQTALEITLQGYPAPENDHSINAILLEGPQTEATFHLNGSGLEENEPGLFSFNKSVWYRWISPGSGLLKLVGKNDLDHESSSTQFTLYTGESFSEFDQIGQTDSGADSPPAETSVIPGQEIFIGITGEFSQGALQDGTFELEFSPHQLQPPEHDSRLAPIDLGSSFAIDLTADNRGSTVDGQEWGSDTFDDSGTLWYRWTAPESGVLYIQSNTGNFLPLPVVELFDASGGGLTAPLLRQQFSGSTPAAHPVIAGQVYLFRYSSWDSTSVKGLASDISFRLEPILPHSLHTSAIALPSQESLFRSDSFRGAITDPIIDYEALGYSSPRLTLWYRWTAPKSGFYRIREEGSTDSIAIWEQADDATLALIDHSQSHGLIFEVTEGNTYLISALSALATSDDGTPAIAWELHPIEATPNDLFDERLDMGSEENWEFASQNYLATAENGEPEHLGESPLHSFWFSWTAPRTGTFYLESEASIWEQRIAVYTGSEISTLQFIGGQSGDYLLNATQGQTYQIALDSVPDHWLDQGIISLTLEPASRPPNDDFANRIVLNGSHPILESNIDYATAEEDEPGLDRTEMKTLWYEWTPAADLRIDLRASSFNVYTSHSPNAEFRALNPYSFNSRLFAGTTYYIQIYENSPSTQGLTTLHSFTNLTASGLTTLPPQNEDFQNRATLPSLTSLNTGVDGRGTQPALSGPASILSTYNAWWSWTAPVSGFYNLEGATALGEVKIYSGDTLESLVEIASGQQVFFAAEAGQTYQIATYRVQKYVPDISDRVWLGLSLNLLNSPPENDDFQHAHEFSPELPFTHSQHTLQATTEPGEPPSAATRTVWSKWTPSFTEDVELSTSSENETISIYLGNRLETLTEQASADGSLHLSVEAGTTYHIRVTSPEPTIFTLAATPIYRYYDNDHFTQAISWNGSSHRARSLENNQTIEADEPRPSSASETDGSSWWKWTAPASGVATVSMGNTSDHVTSIYQGENLRSLNTLAVSSTPPTPLYFSTEAGSTYHIQVINLIDDERADFTLSLDFHTARPANDDFDQAIPLTGAPVSLNVDPTGSSFEGHEPKPASRSIWYSWIPPENGLFTFAVTEGTMKIFRGSALDSLIQTVAETDRVTLHSRTGEPLKIALISEAPSPLQFTIERALASGNDDFANRIHLGETTEAFMTIQPAGATLEIGEPSYPGSLHSGSLWWSWTAPVSGSVTFGTSVHVFEGDTLNSLVSLNSEESQTIFKVEQGVTYQISKIVRPDDDEAYERIVTMKTVSNDDFADREVIPNLPFEWEGILYNATYEPLEVQYEQGSIWWEWTAPRSGEITLNAANVIWSTGRLSMYQDAPSLQALSEPLVSREVHEGETYFFKLENSYLQHRTVQIAWLTPTTPQPGIISLIELQSLETPIHAEGVLDSVWYLWDAPRSGTLTFSHTDGSDIETALLTGPDLGSTATLGYHHFLKSSFQVTAGERHWIQIFKGDSSQFSWQATFGPDGDMFENAPSLPSLPTTSWNGDTTGAGWENGEIPITGNPPERTVWRTWTAPYTGDFLFELDRFAGAVCEGASLDGLRIITQGTSGTFTATSGATYYIVVDSGSEEGPFQLSLQPAPVGPTYTAWRDLYLESGDPQNTPHSDPDQDGRSNLIEMALGSDPLDFDARLAVWVEVLEGDLLLNVRRPIGVKGIEYSFDLSANLESWQSTLDLEHETWTEPQADGSEILRVHLSNTPSSGRPNTFVRLKVSLTP